jgi:hypothetical protein
MSDCEGQVNVTLEKFGGDERLQLPTKPKIQALHGPVYRGFPANQVSSNC